ncbi:transposase [Ichthyobacterium seriolicida]|uniref:Transposase n=1 Tax=Ichthyobacterium seriolicida TaxID=242600 RepID=A0A1J1DX73_9FLAO|nr:transposase [Ichthyobacterium seriolicida]BAV94455.1 transposase [Ichthyobacterium seriolicida]
MKRFQKGELDSHLDYSKYEQSKNTNFRNGYSTNNVRTSLEESKIKVPRDRDSSFNPMLTPKRHYPVKCVKFIFRKKNPRYFLKKTN